MKKSAKFLAALLALVLVIGSIPVQAASNDVSLSKTSKILYLGGCKGTKANGKKAKYYKYLNVAKIVTNFDSATMGIKLSASDKSVCTVSNSKSRIKAKGRGEADVTVKVTNKKTEKQIFKGTIKITVRKNADKDFKVTGIADGKEYEVNDSITVSMPRTEDDDFRKLTCSSSDVTLKKTGTNGSEYKVTFKKAGTYTINAVAYMNNTYKGATATKTFKVTVKGGEEVNPTGTPTEAPTEEPTATPEPTDEPTGTPEPTPTDVVAELSVKQTALDTIVLSGYTDPDSVKAADIELYSKISNIDIPRTGIEKVTSDGKDITIKMLSSFDADVVYYVNIKGFTADAASFKAVSCSPMDIVAIQATNTKVIVNENVDLGLRYFNKDGVDITAGVSSSVLPTVTMKTGGIGDAYASGTKVYFLNPDKTCIFEVSVYKGVDELGTPRNITAEIAVTSYAPQATGIFYTVKTETPGVYLKPTDERSHSFTIDAASPVIEVLFVYQDVKGNITYKTLDEEGITEIKIADEKILFAGAKSATGGWYLQPNNVGTTSCILYKGDKAIAVAEVSVLGKKTPAMLTATVSKANLNVNGSATDSITIQANVKDQYGNDLKGQTITIEQNENTKLATGTVVWGTFDADGKMVLPGSSVILNTGKQNGIIVATLKCAESTATIQFNVADFADANLWALSSDSDANLIQLDTSVKQGDVKPGVVKLNIQARNGAYTVKNEDIRFYPGKQPSPQIKAADLSVAVGTRVFLYTIQKDGKFVDVLPDLVSDASGKDLTFTAFDYQKMLAPGTYVVSAYTLIAGSENSQLSAVGTKTIVVTQNQTMNITFKQIKESTAAIAPIDIVKDCFEFYVDGFVMDPSHITNADVSLSGTGSKYAKSVEITFTNTTYGSYTQTVDVSSSSIIK